MLDSESIRFIPRLCDVLLTKKHKNDIDNFTLLSCNITRAELMFQNVTVEIK